MTAIDRKKYMDQAEVIQLRRWARRAALADLQSGCRTCVVTWAVVDTALSTGLRVSELVRLKVGDVDLRRGALRVWRLKRRKPAQETLAVGQDFTGHLKDYLAWKALVNESTKPSAPLFVGKRGTLTMSGLQRIWKRAIAGAGLPKELSIHCARHTVGVALLRKTRNLRQVQKQLGHADPATTANLYADVSFEDMQDGINGLYDDEPGRQDKADRTPGDGPK